MPIESFSMQKINKDFNLCNKKSEKENTSHDNSVPSTSGTRKKPKYVQKNQKYPDESSSDEDEDYSVHDSSTEEYENLFYSERLSVDEGIGAKTDKPNIGGNADDILSTASIKVTGTSDNAKTDNENVTLNDDIKNLTNVFLAILQSLYGRKRMILRQKSMLKPKKCQLRFMTVYL